jgi:hypothetical protein
LFFAFALLVAAVVVTAVVAGYSAAETHPYNILYG